MGMTPEDLIRHLQSLIVMKDKEIKLLKDEISALKMIIKGMSQEYESHYRDLEPKFEQAEQRIIDFLRTMKGEWIEKDLLERRLLARYPFYSEGTIPRCCRKMAQSGALLVRYVDGKPYYALNLKYDGGP